MIGPARHLRARLASYALVVALCQSAALFSATIVLTASLGATVAAEEECNCEHSAAVSCPMHKRSSARPIPPDVPRWCAGVDDAVHAVLPVFGALALPERIAQSASLAFAPLATAALDEAPRPLVRPPDSPPPRL